MKYAIIKVVNGNFSIANEDTDFNLSIVHFHTVCTTLWNAEDVTKACVKLVNENLETIKAEFIKYDNETI